MRLTALSGCAVLLGLAIAGPQFSIAQNDEAPAKPPQKETRGPLPDHFGKLGVSTPQKEKLYAVQDTYEEKIDTLKQQIAQLEKERDQAMEALLTPGQKLRLQELREEARQREVEARAAADADDSEDSIP